jgi:hypothetical protein
MTQDSFRGSVLLALGLSQTADAALERLWIASPSKRSIVSVNHTQMFSSLFFLLAATADTEKQAELVKDIAKKREYLESTKAVVEQERAAGVSYDFDSPVTDLQKAMRDHTAQLALARARSQSTLKSAIETVEFLSEDGTRVRTNKGLRVTDEMYDEVEQRAAKKRTQETSRAERRKANNEDVPTAFKNGRLKYKTAKMLEDYFTEQVGIEVKGKKLADLRELAVSHFRKQGVVAAAERDEPGPADERRVVRRVSEQQSSPVATESTARVTRTASGGPFGCS